MKDIHFVIDGRQKQTKMIVVIQMIWYNSDLIVLIIQTDNFLLANKWGWRTYSYEEIPLLELNYD